MYMSMVIDGGEDKGGGGNGRKQRSADMNTMNHRTLSSLLLWTYDPQHSTDPFLNSMYVCVCVCGPGASHLLGFLADDKIESDGDLERFGSRSNRPINQNNFYTQAGRYADKLCCPA